MCLTTLLRMLDTSVMVSFTGMCAFDNRLGGKPEIVINQMILVGFSCHDAA
jgi:hypothetical protein